MSTPTPDFQTYKTDLKLIAVEQVENRIQLTWDDTSTALAHIIWLRENCPCHQCSHPQTRERTILLSELSDSLSARDISTTNDGHLRVIWSDNENHESIYHCGWLFENLVKPAQPQPAKTWDASFAKNLPIINGVGIDDDTHPAFTQWVQAISQFGVGILSGTPAEPETVERLATMIGPIRPSNFGNLFDVVSKPDADTLAYTSDELKPHTDLATREYPPGLQFLHCIKNDSDGGQSVLVDGFKIAEIIRDHHPQEYHTLTTVPIHFKNIAKTSDYRWAAPVISLHRDGTFNEIRMTYWLRAPQNATPDEHDRIYKALRLFMALADAPENKIIHLLQPGDIMAFDNRRFLHGRLAFNLKKGQRWLRGCYGEREELLSTLRILQRREN